MLLLGCKSLQHFQRGFVAVDCAFRPQAHQDCFVGSPDARIRCLEAHQEAECLRRKVKIGEFECRAVDLANDQNTGAFHKQLLNLVVLNAGDFCAGSRGHRGAAHNQSAPQEAGSENV